MATPEEKANISKAEQKAKDKKAVKNNAKKSNKSQKTQPKRNRVKETVTELKKVTWPSFGKIVKNTGIVLGIVLVLTLVLFGIDRLLSWIHGLLLG